MMECSLRAPLSHACVCSTSLKMPLPVRWTRRSPHWRLLWAVCCISCTSILLWWLLDKTPGQRATAALVRLTEQLLPSAALTLRLPPIRRFVIAIDELIGEALFGNPATA
jgi:hypothetical protein